MITKILAGALGVAGLALVGTLTIWVPNLYESRAMARVALNAALEANVSLLDERRRAVAEAERNRAISATALKDAAELGAQVAAIRERIRNGSACQIDPMDAEALDRLFRN
ncbi:MAG: hypothetical protein KF889_25345 [Alphaproteobacteria bacterium]|nr:hypothetical protein [Alphaproteobacteria bacterium]MCW5739681.1 hypothetical protein [Alphaproteobacteria bacterium]